MADAGADRDVIAATTVALDASASRDEAGQLPSVRWAQTGGIAVGLSSATSIRPTFTAPSLAVVELDFLLTVRSSTGATATDSVRIRVVPGADPVADAGVSQSVAVGSLVTLDGSASRDPDGRPIMFFWGQSGGPFVAMSNTAVARPTFTAPSSPATLTFQLLISNGVRTSAPAFVTVNVGGSAASTTTTTAPPRTPVRLFAGAAPRNQSSDSNRIEVGVRVRPSVAGVIAAVHYYRLPAAVGTHVATVWDSSGNALASATFTNETASGWQSATLWAPVPVQAGATYVVSVLLPGGYYAYDLSGDPQGLDQQRASTPTGHLVAPAHSASAPNGLYRYGGGYPLFGFGANFWVDATFVAG